MGLILLCGARSGAWAQSHCTGLAQLGPNSSMQGQWLGPGPATQYLETWWLGTSGSVNCYRSPNAKFMDPWGASGANNMAPWAGSGTGKVSFIWVTLLLLLRHASVLWHTL